jgi:hypothetical protein
MGEKLTKQILGEMVVKTRRTQEYRSIEFTSFTNLGMPQDVFNDPLLPYQGLIRPLVRQHEGNRWLRDAIPDENWNVAIRTTAVCDTTYDLTVRFERTVGMAQQVAVAVEFAFDSWLDDDYLLLPSAVYHGNDFEVLNTPYPPLWRDVAQFRQDMPVTTTPAPRFARDSPRLEQSTGDTASPCMGFHSKQRGFGFLVQSTQGSSLGNHGLTVERHGDGIRLLVTAPCVREFRQDHCKALPSADRAVDWAEGDCLEFQFRVVLYRDHGLQSLFSSYAALRKTLNHSEIRHTLPFSAAWRIVEDKYNQSNWVEPHGYYKMAPNFHTTFEVVGDPLCFLWQLGWVGGGMMTLPMLAQGGRLTRERAWKNLEMIFDKTIGPAGWFRGIGDGEHFYPDGVDRPLPHRMHMVRKSGDWLLFALKQFDLLKKQDRAIPAVWQKAIRDLADAIVALYDKHGQFGQFVDGDTGELLIGGSAAGAILPAALARASAWFDEPRYLHVADASARKLYAEFTVNGLATGGPGEILSAPDSESAFSLVESFVTLFEMTSDGFYIQATRDAIEQASTWVTSYDYQFPPQSTLAKSGARSTGAVFANIQNKHGAPGICTLSGDSLFRFWRATGDALALDLIRDIAHGIPQYLSRADAPLGEAMHPGWMCERVNLSDWETPEGVGNNLFGSCSWAETALMLTTWEIPSLYVQLDTGLVIVFDHIIAEVMGHSDQRMEVKLTNPTVFDADIKVLCENSSEIQKPLPMNALFDALILHIPAGSSLCHTFSRHE